MTVTLVRDQGELLPFAPGAPVLLVEFAEFAARGKGSALAAAVQRTLSVEHLVLPLDPGESYARHTLDRARQRPAIVATRNALHYVGQVFLVRVLAEAGARLVVVAAGETDDLPTFPHVACYIKAEGLAPREAEALVDLLTGRVNVADALTP